MEPGKRRNVTIYMITHSLVVEAFTYYSVVGMCWHCPPKSNKQGRQESRGGPGKYFHVREVHKFLIIHVEMRTCVNEFVYTNHKSITDYSTQVFTH